MDCHQVLEYLKTNLGKKVPRHMGSIVREHLQQCPECQNSYQELYKSYLKEKKKGGSTYKPSTESSFLPVKFPGYKILRKLGHGAMGKVYQAFQISLKRHVALKVLSEDLAQNAKFVKRFLREARALAEMKHPNVVGVYDVGFSQGIFYYIMEYVEGESLKDVLVRRGPLPMAEALELVIQVAKALSHAQEHNIVHRDIKPGNILIDLKGEAKLADLGLAKKRWEQEQVSEETAVGTLIGTPHYMAPEQIKNSRDVTIQADLYSLGVTFYQMLTGVTPHDGSTNFEVLSNIIHEEVNFDEKRDHHISESYRQVILKMLEKDPQYRYGSPEELLKDLEDLKHGRFAKEEMSFSRRMFALPAEMSSKLVLWSVSVGAMGTLIIVLILLLIFWKFSTSPGPIPKPSPPISHPVKPPVKPPIKPPIKHPVHHPSGQGEKTRSYQFVSELFKDIKAKKIISPSMIRITKPVLVVRKRLLKSKRGNFNTQLYINNDEDSQSDLLLYFPFKVDNSMIRCGEYIYVLRGRLQKYKYNSNWEISYKPYRTWAELRGKSIEKYNQNSGFLKGFVPLSNLEPPIKSLDELLKEGLHDNVLIQLEGEIEDFQIDKSYRDDKREKTLKIGFLKIITGKFQGKIPLVLGDYTIKTLQYNDRSYLLRKGKIVVMLGAWKRFTARHYPKEMGNILKIYQGKWMLMVRDVRPVGER